VRSRDGLYAGCAWLVIAAVVAVGAYWGLGIAGPSALPGVMLLLGVAAGSVALAAALWTGFGGRRVALISLTLGVVLAVIPMTEWSGSDQTGVETRFGTALFGVAVALASAYAARHRRGESRRPQ
jgi:hypothetical protein